MTDTPNIITLSTRDEYTRWKTQIEFFAKTEDSLDILRGNITIDNAIELINRTDKYLEENEMEIDQSEHVGSQTKTTKATNPRARIAEAEGIFHKRDTKLFSILMGSISTDIFNSIDITIDIHAANLYKNICATFEPKENLEMLQIEFLNSKLTYGEDAARFYRKLREIFNKLQRLDSIMGEQSLKNRALQAMPNELKSVKLNLFKASKEIHYDELVQRIIEDYNDEIEINPPNKIVSINQSTRLEHIDNHDDNDVPTKDHSKAIDLLHRMNAKFCSYCLRNNYKRPGTHSDDECGHLHPELKDKHNIKGNLVNRFGNQRTFVRKELQPKSYSAPAEQLKGHLTPQIALFDQGADSTCTCRRDLLTNVRQLDRPEYFQTASGWIKATTVGTMTLNLAYKNGTISWIDTEAFYSPSFRSTLISANLLKKYNLGITYQPGDSATFFDNDSKAVKHKVPLTNGKLTFRLNVTPIDNFSNYVLSVSRTKKSTLTQWHTRLGHLNEQSTRSLLKRLYSITFPRKQSIDCESCKINKANQPPFDGKLDKAQGPLNILHSDLMNIPTDTDEKYVLVIIDEYTRHTWTFPLKYKSDVFEIITQLHIELERQTGYKIKRIHTDRAKEYMSERLDRYYRSHGIVTDYTAGYAPSSNGIAERYNQTLQRGIATLLTDAKLPNDYWMFAMNYYTYIKNCSPHSSVETTPIEELFNTKPPIHRLKAFGCRAYIQHPSIETNKISPTRSPGIFLGFDKNSNGAIIQINEDILISRNVNYNEHEFPGVNNINTIYSANHSFAYRSPLSLDRVENQDDSTTEASDEEELPNEPPLSTHSEAELPNETSTNTHSDSIENEEELTNGTSLHTVNDVSLHEQLPTEPMETDHSTANREYSKESTPLLVNNMTKQQTKIDTTPINESILDTRDDTNGDTNHPADHPLSTNTHKAIDNQVEPAIPMDTENDHAMDIIGDVAHEVTPLQTTPKATTASTIQDKPKIAPTIKTIYDKFDNQEESPTEYLMFNHSFKRKVPPPTAKGTPIQPGQARQAALIAKDAEDKRRKHTETAQKDINYERLQEQWSHFDSDKQQRYPDPDSLLQKTISKLLHVDHTLAAKAEPNKKLRHAYALAKQQVTNDIPSTYRQAVMHPNATKWRQGMEEEMANHERNNTWTLIDPNDVPKNTNIVGSRWVFNIKTNAMNEPIKWKARLVAQGFSQKPGIDYEETYAPVTSLRIIRLLIAIAIEENLQIHQMDVTGAYLYGKIDQPTYMKLPPGAYENQKDRKICKLNKALYGLRQSGRIWYELLNKVLRRMGFNSSYAEPCLYYSEQSDAIISVYVDDLLIITRTTTMADKIKLKLKDEFEMKDLGTINHILGMKINYNQDQGIATLDQSGYIAKALEDLDLQNTKRKSIPMSTNLTLSNEDSPSTKDHIDEMKTKPYAQAIGKLNWIAQASRPDIAFATSMCGRYTQNPGIKHWNAVRQIYGYLKNTIDTKIEFRRKTQRFDGYCKGVILSKDIKGHVDADYAGCWDTARSTSGCVFTYSGGAIAWTSKRQKCVATSTGEAEYMAIKHGSDIAIWLRNVMEHIGRSINSPIPIKTDNTAALTNILNPGSITGLKHIRVQYHASKERHEQKEIEVKGIRTFDQLADIFTKALNGNQLKILCERMGTNICTTKTEEDKRLIDDSQYNQEEECWNPGTGPEHTESTKDETRTCLADPRDKVEVGTTVRDKTRLTQATTIYS